MTAKLFRTICDANGLRCVAQEQTNWRGRRLIDCFTTFAHSGSKWKAAGKILRNPKFMREAQSIRRRSA